MSTVALDLLGGDGAPDVVADAEYYRPTAHGAEAAVKERWERVRRIIRGGGATGR